MTDDFTDMLTEFIEKCIKEDVDITRDDLPDIFLCSICFSQIVRVYLDRGWGIQDILKDCGKCFLEGQQKRRLNER